MRVFATPAALADVVGEEVAVSDWITVEQDAIDAFAETTGDRQWIHVDRARAARESPTGTTIAHGYLTLSLVPALLQSCLRVDGVAMALNYGLDRVRFPAPLPAGGRIRARATLAALAQVAGGVQATWHVDVETDGGKRPVCSAQLLARYLPAT